MSRTPIVLHRALRVVESSLTELLVMLRAPALLTLAMSATVLLCLAFLSTGVPSLGVGRLLVPLGAGVLVYMAGALLFARDDLKELLALGGRALGYA